MKVAAILIIVGALGLISNNQEKKIVLVDIRGRINFGIIWKRHFLHSLSYSIVKFFFLYLFNNEFKFFSFIKIRIFSFFFSGFPDTPREILAAVLIMWVYIIPLGVNHYSIICEFFTPVLSGCLLLESEWQQISSALQESSENSSWF